MQILRPGQTFKIVWVISDPSDVTTYFPQAVILNSLDGSLVATVNLILEIAGRYSANWQVPGDRTGQGTQIDITVNAYTDAAHTTLTGIYAQENRVYNIYDLAASARGGGGGVYVDYREIEKLIKKYVLAIVIPDAGKHIAALGERLEYAVRALARLQAMLPALDNSEIINAGFAGQGKSLEANMAGLVTALHENREMSGQRHDMMVEAFQTAAVAMEEQVAGLQVAFFEVKSILEAHGVSLQSLPELAKTLGLIKSITKALSGIETVTMKRGINLDGAEPEAEPVKKKDYLEMAKNLSIQ